MRHKLGDVREDGFIFYQYCKKANGVGHYEKWLSPESFANSIQAIRTCHKRHAADPIYVRRKLDQIKAKHREDYRHVMFHATKMKCKKYNLPFTLRSFEDIPFFTHCPVFGWKFEIGVFGRSPSIDRLIPEIGYTKENIIVVSTLANTIKTNAHPDQIMLVAKFYKKLFKKLGLE